MYWQFLIPVIVRFRLRVSWMPRCWRRRTENQVRSLSVYSSYCCGLRMNWMQRRLSFHDWQTWHEAH